MIKMFVLTVSSPWGDDAMVIGVFSSREAAEAYISAHPIEPSDVYTEVYTIIETKLLG